MNLHTTVGDFKKTSFFKWTKIKKLTAFEGLTVNKGYVQ